jgi:hypothetical protein
VQVTACGGGNRHGANHEHEGVHEHEHEHDAEAHEAAHAEYRDGGSP